MSTRGDLSDRPTADCVLPGRITAIKTQATRPGRVNIFVDGAFCFACRGEVARQLQLQLGSEVTPELRANVMQEDAVLSAYSAAIDLLAHRARSEREIRDRLRRRDFDTVVIDRVILRLREHRYLDDAEFARAWIENRTTHRPRGDRALRQELRRKGVDNQVIDTALDVADLDQAAMALEAARRKAPSLAGLDPRVRQRRLIGFLQRRGFGWDAIGPAVAIVLGPFDDTDQAEIESNPPPE